MKSRHLFQVTLKKVSVALENTVQKMQKVEKKDTKVKSQGFQPVESAAQKIQEAVAQDYTKVSTILFFPPIDICLSPNMSA